MQGGDLLAPRLGAVHLVLNGHSHRLGALGVPATDLNQTSVGTARRVNVLVETGET